MRKCENCDKIINNLGGFLMHKKHCDKIHLNKDFIINDYVNEFYSIHQLKSKYKTSAEALRLVLKDLIRDSSEAIKISHKKNQRKLSSETKQKLSIARTKWLFENQDKSVWRERKTSYPEQIFLEKVEELELYKKYLIIREKCVFPYYIDFAFEYEKVAIEIDGEQHDWENNKKRDIEKDKKLQAEGWRIYRVSAKQVLQNRDLVLDDILKFIGESDNEYKKCGLELYIGKRKEEEIKKKLEREHNKGITDSQKNNFINKRKVKRPLYKDLISDVENIGVHSTAKKYNVTYNSIKKWILWYKKYE
jgi:very-short-patch-repair endonuclease